VHSLPAQCIFSILYACAIYSIWLQWNKHTCTYIHNMSVDHRGAGSVFHVEGPNTARPREVHESSDHQIAATKQNTAVDDLLLKPLEQRGPPSSSTFAFTIYHSLDLSLQTQNSSLSQTLSSGIVFLISSGLSSRIWNLYWTKWPLVLVCFSFFFLIFFLHTRARLSWSHSAFESMLNSSIVLYRIVL